MLCLCRSHLTQHACPEWGGKYPEPSGVWEEERLSCRACIRGYAIFEIPISVVEMRRVFEIFVFGIVLGGCKPIFERTACTHSKDAVETRYSIEKLDLYYTLLHVLAVHEHDIAVIQKDEG